MSTFKLPPLPRRAVTPRLASRPSTSCARKSRPTVVCAVEYGVKENEEEREQDCVTVTCSECNHSEQSWGHGEKSVRRCLALMGENCPEDQNNFYVLEEG